MKIYPIGDVKNVLYPTKILNKLSFNPPGLPCEGRGFDFRLEKNSKPIKIILVE